MSLGRFVASVACLLAAGLAGCASDSKDDESAESELNESKALGMTDVTILYPLPKSLDNFDDMLGPSSEIAQGELLPPAIFAEIAKLPAPPMQNGPEGQSVDPGKPLFADWDDSFPLLRVVGIRLDPCFGETSNLGAGDCMNTIRLTAQFFPARSLVPDGRSAIHLFYKLSREDFTALAKGMLELRQATGLPLVKGLVGQSSRETHPTLTEQGLRGPYATGLKNVILKYAGEKTLTRVAFCVEDRSANPTGAYYANSTPVDNRWVFGGFEYASGRLRPMGISTLNYTGLQTVDTIANNARRDFVVVTPAIVVPDNFLQVFNRKPEANGRLDPAKFEQAKSAALKLADPNKYTTKNADCVSCHMAKQAAPNKEDPNGFKSYTFRLEHSNDILGPFRMFGYDTAGRPIISGRVANETAVVLEYLNKNVLR